MRTTLDRRQTYLAAELERLTLAGGEDNIEFAAAHIELFRTLDEMQMEAVRQRLYSAAAKSSGRGTVH